MNRMTEKEYRSCVLDILKFFLEFCRNKNIDVWVDSGTLLGAIRHNGFIPWDDDIDVIVFRKDYKKIKEFFEDNTKVSRYSLITVDEEKNCYRGFSKLYDTKTLINENNKGLNGMGAFIDIFPIDNIPDSSIKRFIFFNRVRFWKVILDGITSEVNPKENIVFRTGRRMIKKLFSPQKSVGKLNNALVSWECCDNCKSITSIAPPGTKKYKVMSREWFTKTLMHRFEDIEVPIPSGYDDYLSLMFGDYMVLPPENKQINHHIEAFWK